MDRDAQPCCCRQLVSAPQPGLAGRVALVTGASRGLGAAIAAGLVRAGAKVMLTDVRDQLGRELAASLGDAAIYARLDAADSNDWRRALDECEERLGPLDILVNNAFRPAVAGIETETLEGWNSVLRVTLFGGFFGMREALRRMSGRGGAVVNVSSTHGGDVAVPGLVAYQSAKGGLSALTRHGALVGGNANIRVNAVHPGPIRTPVIEEMGMTSGQEEMGQQLPIGRTASPDEVAAAVLFLASAEASAITGTTVVVDGGYTAI